MNYIVTKPIKSKTVAVLLIHFLGPFGLFYSSVFYGVVMCFAVPVLWSTLFFYNYTSLLEMNLSGEFLIISFVGYYIFLWLFAFMGVSNYNNKIIEEANYQQEILNSYQANAVSKVTDNEDKILFDWLKRNPDKSIDDFYAK